MAKPCRLPVAGAVMALMIGCLALVSAQKKIDIGIVVAVVGEYRALYAKLDASPEPVNITKHGRTFTEGAIANKSVVIVACGVGMTNAAMTTQMLIDSYNATYLIFQGIAGGVDPEHKVGDVIIPNAWINVHHQKLIRTVLQKKSQKPTRLFYEIGRDFPNRFVINPKTNRPVSLMAPFANAPAATDKDKAVYKKIDGVEFHTGFSIPMAMETLADPADGFLDFPPQHFYFNVSAKLFAAAKAVAASGTVVLQRNATIGGVVKDIGHQPLLQVLEAPGASSSTFLDNKEYREKLYNIFNAQAFEMEGASFMHVCASCKKECMVIRSLSDLAGGGEDFVNVISTFLTFASANTAIVTRAIIATLTV